MTEREVAFMLPSLDIPSWVIWGAGILVAVVVVLSLVPALRRLLQASEQDDVTANQRARAELRSPTHVQRQGLPPNTERRADPSTGGQQRTTQGGLADRERDEFRALVTQLSELGYQITKLTAVGDEVLRTSSRQSEVVTRTDLERCVDVLTRAVQTAAQQSAEQIVYAIADLSDENRKLTQSLRDLVSGLREVQLETTRQVAHIAQLTGQIGVERSRTSPLPPVTAPTTTTERPPASTETLLSTTIAEPIERLIMSRFDELDRATNRNFASLKGEFRRLLGERVSDISLQDDAVLFYTSPERAVVHPWRNVPLNRVWHPYFALRGRSNVPIRKVNRPAVLVRKGDGAWATEAMGDIENAD